MLWPCLLVPCESIWFLLFWCVAQSSIFFFSCALLLASSLCVVMCCVCVCVPFLCRLLSGSHIFHAKQFANEVNCEFIYSIYDWNFFFFFFFFGSCCCCCCQCVSTELPGNAAAAPGVDLVCHPSIYTAAFESFGLRSGSRSTTTEERQEPNMRA